MSTVTQNQPEIIKFYSPKQITSSELLSFTSKYLHSLEGFRKHLNENLGREITLNFTRINEDGSLQEIREFSGTIKDIEENQFTFLSFYNLSGEYESDQLIKNIIRTDNVLGIIPIWGKMELSEILKINRFKDQGYNDFLNKIKKSLRKFIGTQRHVEIELNEHILDAIILEVNKSNLLVTIHREYSKRTNPDGSYQTVILGKRVGNLLFIRKNDFVKKVTIYSGDININPFDED